MLSTILAISLQAPTQAIATPVQANRWLVEFVIEVGGKLIKDLVFTQPWFEQEPFLPQPAKEAAPNADRRSTNRRLSTSKTFGTPHTTATALMQQFQMQQPLPVQRPIQVASRQWYHSTCYSTNSTVTYGCIKLLANQSSQVENFVGCVFTNPRKTNGFPLADNNAELIVEGTIVDYRYPQKLIWLKDCRVIGQASRNLSE